MTGSPFRERRVPPGEVRRIVKRAAVLAMVHAGDEGGEALSEAELARRLGELGVPAELARRAMEPEAGSLPTNAADGATRVTREVEIDGMIPPERHEEIAEAIAAAMGMSGRVSVVGNKLTWVPGGIALEPAVTVRSRNGRTRIEYVETLANRGQLAVGFGTLGALGGTMASAAGLALGSGLAHALEMSAQQAGPVAQATAAVLGIGAAAASVVGLRRLFARRVTARSAFADSVMARVVTAARAAAETSTMNVRVAADDDRAELDAEGPDARVPATRHADG